MNNDPKIYISNKKSYMSELYKLFAQYIDEYKPSIDFLKQDKNCNLNVLIICRECKDFMRLNINKTNIGELYYPDKDNFLGYEYINLPEIIYTNTRVLLSTPYFNTFISLSLSKHKEICNYLNLYICGPNVKVIRCRYISLEDYSTYDNFRTLFNQYLRILVNLCNSNYIPTIESYKDIEVNQDVICITSFKHFKVPLEGGKYLCNATSENHSIEYNYSLLYSILILLESSKLRVIFFRCYKLCKLWNLLFKRIKDRVTASRDDISVEEILNLVIIPNTISIISRYLNPDNYEIDINDEEELSEDSEEGGINVSEEEQGDDPKENEVNESDTEEDIEEDEAM